MQNSYQTDSETVYDHGKAVWNYFNKIITNDIGDMKIPDWYSEYKDRILKNIPDKNVIEQYCIFHDIGKCFCCEIDKNGKRHFPDHEIISEQKWQELSENIPSKALISKLIRHDMLLHREKADYILPLA